MAPSQRQIEEREARKQRILDGALNVFKANGIEGATMDHIAQESGFGKATLYYYFKSKEDVFSEILEAGWKNIWESLEPIIADQGSPRNSFIKLLIKIAEIAPVLPSSSVPANALGNSATIPVKIINEIPLPIPLEVTCSPNHIKNITPPSSVKTVVTRKNTPGSVTAPALSKPTENPYPWTIARTTVKYLVY